MKRWAIGLLAGLLLLTAACGGGKPLLPKAETAERFQALINEQLQAYSDLFHDFSDRMETFYQAVEQRGGLEGQTEYQTLAEELERWCKGLEEYDPAGIFVSCEALFQNMQELIPATRTFLTAMQDVNTTEEMDQVIDTFVSAVSPILAQLSEKAGAQAAQAPAEDSDWIVGTWVISDETGENRYEYRADGTVLYPDGSQYVWRRSGADEVADASVWKAALPTGDTVQTYFISTDGKDMLQKAVRRNEDGSLTVVEAVIYSEQTTEFTYLPDA